MIASPLHIDGHKVETAATLFRLKKVVSVESLKYKGIWGRVYILSYDKVSCVNCVQLH